jgi:hypothetical protein
MDPYTYESLALAWRAARENRETRFPLADGRPPQFPVPYPQFCSQPHVCAGKTSCPRDPSCSE